MLNLGGNMKLNHTELKSFFYGTLLGDSYIHNNSFNCKQITKSLIEFKADIINQYIPNANVKILSYKGYVDKNGVNHQDYYQLYASPTEYFRKLNKIFYLDKKKIYPTNTIKQLTSLGFAMWYADDGTSILVGKNETTQGAKHRRVQFCTDGFTYLENIQIQKELVECGYNCKLIDRKRKNQYRVEISPQDGQNLFQELEIYFQYFPEMLYKLDLGYRGKSLQYRRYVSEQYENLYSKISAHPQFIDRIIER